MARPKGSKASTTFVPFIVGVRPVPGEILLTREEHARLRRWVDTADQLSAKAARGDQAAAEDYRAHLGGTSSRRAGIRRL